MPLAPGSTLASYEVLGLLGAGGMGEVFRARDTRLGREVAIKALPPAFARDAERLARFEREARILAAVHHPNVAGIHGLEEIEGHRYLVLEFVDGETLAERLSRGPISARECVEIGLQIAAALEAAHEAGIVHRDLKPANIKQTPAGQIKVLDFGLAKGSAGSADSSSFPGLSQSPTIALAQTGAGIILGTAAYMSPEQARGKAVDRRTDIWSLGCVLYECLTGRPVFQGETMSDLIARILEREPEWNALPGGTPARLRNFLQRCLDKDPRHRLRDAGDARLELEAILADFSSTIQAAPALPARRVAVLPIVAWGLVAGLAVTAAFLYVRGGAPAGSAARVVRFQIPPPPGLPLPPEPDDVSVSPDGRFVAFGSLDSSGTSRLYVRPLDSMESRVVDGTENADLPFWSPDSRHLGFFAEGKLKRVAVEGGRAEVLAPANNGRGGTWNRSGVIVFAPAGEGPLFRTSERGGTPEQITVLDTTRQQTAHRFPCFLPDGERFLYCSLPARQGQLDIWVGSLRGGEPKHLMTAETAPFFVAPGWLLYNQREHVTAHRFDAKRAALVGEPIRLEAPVIPSLTMGSPSVSASPAGVLAYVSGELPDTRLYWLDRSGRRIGQAPVKPGKYLGLWLSPDETRAATHIATNGVLDIWIVDLERGTLSRFTFGGADHASPLWSPDGREIVYESDKSGHWELYVKPVGGAGEEALLYESPAQFKHPVQWSADGRTILFEQLDEATGWDIWALDVKSRQARPLLRSPFNEQAARLSPDGRWMVYSSDEAGRGELFVRSHPGGDYKAQITNGGGFQGSFRKDGLEMLLGVGDGLSAQALALPRGPGSLDQRPRTLFRLDPRLNGFAPAPDHQRFLVALPEDDGPVPALHVVVDWTAELERR